MKAKQSKRGRGRPPKLEGRKSQRIDLRASPEEKEEWESAASRVGRSLSDWIRAVLADAARRV
jgi:uncharacterized protein (DUF1778 family)